MSGAIKNFLVGLFVIVAVVLLFTTVLFLKPKVGDDKQVLLVRFSDINRINVGTRVMFAGRPVGEVAAISEIRDARGQPTDELGRVYFYELKLKIDSGIKVYNTDEISLQTSGLLGEKSIAIIPKAPALGIVPTRISNQPVYANSVDPLENAIVEFSELSGSVEETLQTLGRWMKDHGEEVATSIKAVGTASRQIELAVNSVNNELIIPSVKQTVDQFNTVLAQVTSAMGEMAQKETFTNLGDAVQSIKVASQNIDQIAGDISQGKGTIGRLVVNDDLYLSTNAIMTKLNTLMNDVNNYGVLFHLNKRWQRGHLQDVSLQNALNNPKNFRSYFENEVDEINTSMGRLSMLIHEASGTSEQELIRQSDQFKRNFADLLRQADQLSDNLRLYNQQLLDQKNDG